MNYLQWDCKTHGNYRYKTKYQPNCDECFAAALKEIEEYKELHKTWNQEVVNLKYDNQRLRKVLADNI